MREHENWTMKITQTILQIKKQPTEKMQRE